MAEPWKPIDNIPKNQTILLQWDDGTEMGYLEEPGRGWCRWCPKEKVFREHWDDPKAWRPIDPPRRTFTLTIPEDGEGVVTSSWILRSFLGNVIENYFPGAPRRLEAAQIVQDIINQVEHPESKHQLQEDCDRYIKELRR